MTTERLESNIVVSVTDNASESYDNMAESSGALNDTLVGLAVTTVVVGGNLGKLAAAAKATALSLGGMALTLLKSKALIAPLLGSLGLVAGAFVVLGMSAKDATERTASLAEGLAVTSGGLLTARLGMVGLDKWAGQLADKFPKLFLWLFRIKGVLLPLAGAFGLAAGGVMVLNKLAEAGPEIFHNFVRGIAGLELALVGSGQSADDAAKLYDNLSDAVGPTLALKLLESSDAASALANTMDKDLLQDLADRARGVSAVFGTEFPATFAAMVAAADGDFSRLEALLGTRLEIPGISTAENIQKAFSQLDKSIGDAPWAIKYGIEMDKLKGRWGNSQIAYEKFMDALSSAVPTLALRALNKTLDLIDTALKTIVGELIHLIKMDVSPFSHFVDHLWIRLKDTLQDTKDITFWIIEKLFGAEGVRAAQAFGESIKTFILKPFKDTVDIVKEIWSIIRSPSWEGLKSLGSGILNREHGGIVPGPTGSPQLAVVHGGEYVIPVGGKAPGGGGGPIVVQLVIRDKIIGEVAIDAIMREARFKAGFTAGSVS